MIDLVIDQRRKDLGGFEVGRVLPFHAHRMVGPFVFFDHMGPVDFQPGFPRTVDVRPHPHIGLSTVTYLFDGSITHRDSVGSSQVIHPGEVNWMTAGKGITHSERFEDLRADGGSMHGIQAWVALPAADEETDHNIVEVAARERHLEEVLRRLLAARADGLGHLVGLAQPGADVPLPVADDDQRGEGEPPAALDHLGDAIDVHDPVVQLREIVRIDRSSH